jgi:chemotaxis protein histidine kinase CheA
LAAKPDALQLIADEFVGSLPERMTAIDAAFDTLLKAPNEADLLHDFYHKVHNLTGSSGTFGFSQFSMIARNILILLEPSMKEKSPPTDGSIQAVKLLLEEFNLEAKAPVQLEDWL